MRIAIIATPWYPVPPCGYGGIELVAYLQARELTARGHQVTVFGHSDSLTEGGFDVVPLAGPEWEEDLHTPARTARLRQFMVRVLGSLERRRFDVIQDHSELAGLPVWYRRASPPVVSTIHSALEPFDSPLLEEVSGHICLVAVSRSQRAGAPGARWAAVIHNSVDLDRLVVGTRKRDLLLQLARICPDKGQHISIQVARAAGLPLVLAGKVEADAEGRAYFREQVEPWLGRGVTWIENVQGEAKARLLSEARAMLFPIQWEEPFGLAMVEAMASGTPVIATPRGAAPELVADGVTGFLADHVEGMLAALGRLGELRPEAIAATARRRFCPSRMAGAYEALYKGLLAGGAAAG